MGVKGVVETVCNYATHSIKEFPEHVKYHREQTELRASSHSIEIFQKGTWHADCRKFFYNDGGEKKCKLSGYSKHYHCGVNGCQSQFRTKEKAVEHHLKSHGPTIMDKMGGKEGKTEGKT